MNFDNDEISRCPILIHQDLKQPIWGCFKMGMVMIEPLTGHFTEWLHVQDEAKIRILNERILFAFDIPGSGVSMSS